MKRIFTCKNGHEYENKEPVTTITGASLINKWEIFPWKRIKPNDTCKICGEVIIKESDYVNEKLVMGAVRI